LIDNETVPREYAARWSGEGRNVTLTLERDGGNAIYMFEVVAPDEFVVVGLEASGAESAFARTRGSPALTAARQRWRRCQP
jgi:hypothetical protein